MTGEKQSSPKTVDEYIGQFSKPVKISLKKLRNLIRSVVPKDTEECISYQMPGYKYHGVLVWFAAFKNHYSLFSKPNVLKAYEKELEPYDTTKSAIHFHYDQPLPVELIKSIVQYAINTNLEKPKKK